MPQQPSTPGAAALQYKEMASIPLDQLTALYTSVEWLGYTRHPDKMARLLPGCLWHISAWQGDRLVGLLRAVGDDASIAYIQDILVDPAFQRQGIGRTLLERAFARFAHIRQIVLITDNEEKTVAFYRSLGMQPVEGDYGRAFMKINFEL